MNRPEENHPAVIALAAAFVHQRREMGLTTLEAIVAMKLALEVILTEAGVVAAPLYALRQMIDEIELARSPETVTRPKP